MEYGVVVVSVKSELIFRLNYNCYSALSSFGCMKISAFRMASICLKFIRSSFQKERKTGEITSGF